MYKDLCDNVRSNCWTSRINTIINQSQLRYNCNANSNTYHSMKRTIRDQFLQSWNTNINSLPKPDYFCKFKESFELEHHLKVITNDNLRKHMIRLR